MRSLKTLIVVLIYVMLRVAQGNVGIAGGLCVSLNMEEIVSMRLSEGGYISAALYH